jgi:hypothetical protein
LLFVGINEDGKARQPHLSLDAGECSFDFVIGRLFSAGGRQREAPVPASWVSDHDESQAIVSWAAEMKEVTHV